MLYGKSLLSVTFLVSTYVANSYTCILERITIIKFVSIAGPGKTDVSAVPNMYQTINSCYGKGAATVNT